MSLSQLVPGYVINTIGLSYRHKFSRLKGERCGSMDGGSLL